MDRLGRLLFVIAWICSIIFIPLLIQEYDFMEFNHTKENIFIQWFIGLVYLFIYIVLSFSIREIFIVFKDIYNFIKNGH